MWRKVASIHADKGSLYETNLLTQLQNTRYDEKESMRDHIAKMTELRERLAEMNAPVRDESFVSYLGTSLSLAPSYRTLFTTLSTTARQTGKKLTPSDLLIVSSIGIRLIGTLHEFSLCSARLYPPSARNNTHIG